MPTVSKGGKGGMHGGTHQNSEHTKEQYLERSHHRSRDEVKGAYAGDENEALFKREDHPTDLKARKTKKSATRTPEV